MNDSFLASGAVNGSFTASGVPGDPSHRRNLRHLPSSHDEHRSGRVRRQRSSAVEPGGVEPVADADRHGTPRQLAWTWASPNLEFATIFVGVLAVTAFGLSFWQAALAAVIGNGLGALAHGV